MTKSNKALSILISVLIVISGVNLLVNISNTFRIRQLENAPPVVIETYSPTEEATTPISTDNETTPLSEKASAETTTEALFSVTTQSETTKASFTKTEPDTSSEEKTTAVTTAESAPSSSDSGFCFVTSSGTKYHKDGCSYLKKSKTKMTVAEAKQNGYSPCSRCY